MGSALKYSNVSKYYDPDCRFNGVFSRNNLPWIKDGANVIDLEDRKCKAKHWVSLFLDKNTAVYFDSFGIEYILQEALNKIKDKSFTKKIFRIRDDDSIVWILLYSFHRIYDC